MMHSIKERILAWIGIACLIILYIVSFFLGISKNEAAFPMFLASLLATFFIPVMIYLFQWFVKRGRERNASFAEKEPDIEDEEN